MTKKQKIEILEKIVRQNSCHAIECYDCPLDPKDTQKSCCPHDEAEIKNILAKLRKPKKKWVPKVGEKYFVIHSDGEIEPYIYMKSSFEDKAIKFGNCFRTRAAAVRARKLVREALKKVK
jgi:hypothetical protein